MEPGKICPELPGEARPQKTPGTVFPANRGFLGFSQARGKGGNAPANEEMTLCCYEIIAAFGGSLGVWHRAVFQSGAGELVDILPVAWLPGGLRGRLADGLVGTGLAEEPERHGTGTAEQHPPSVSNFVHIKTI